MLSVNYRFTLVILNNTGLTSLPVYVYCGSIQSWRSQLNQMGGGES